MDIHNPVPVQGTPPADHEIDTALVFGLLSDQHPDLSHLPLRREEAGWDNTLFRLGDRLSVRLPRRAAAADLIVHEQTWLPRLAGHLTLPVPFPYRIGQPGRGYPWRWSVLPWMPGIAADLEEPDVHQAQRLAGFLRSLHVPAPADAPANAVRGVPLRQRVSAVETRMERIATMTDRITHSIRGLWERALDAPMDTGPVWLHGDLHPRNILVKEGVISGIIDWGDITAGDCATDLASIWMLFEEPYARHQALEAYGPSQATVDRARGWSVLFGVMLLDSGWKDNPRNVRIGERTLRRLTEAP